MWSHVFFSAPHRVFFAGGLIQLLLALIFWTLELAARLSGLALPWSLPATWLHGGMMLYGIFPWFILGFLTTALPKWMSHGPLLQRQYLPPFLFLALGGFFHDLGFFWSELLCLGTSLAALGLLYAVVVLLGITLQAREGKVHAGLSLVCLSLGALGLFLHGVAMVRQDGELQALVVLLGIWGFLLPLFYIILHRMLPFFSAMALGTGATAWHPVVVLYLMLLALGGHAVLAALAVPTWPVDALAAGLAWLSLVRWGFRASLGIPMLAMLHWGWFWAALALSLYALQSLLLTLGLSWGGLAPLHVLGLGFFLSVLIGMGTRVTRGHSGRPISEDRWGWRCFLLLQAAVVLRLLGEFLPGDGVTNLLAALLATLALLGWGTIYGPMYCRPRPDGQPG